MRSFHVIDNLKLGGTQNLAMRTWRELDAREVEVGVAVLFNSEKEHVWESTPASLHRLGCHGDYRRPFAIGEWSRQLADVVRQTKPDLIHSWLWLSDVVAAKAAAKCGVPHVSHIVDRRNWQLSNRLRDRLRRWATKRVCQKADTHFLAVSGAAGQFAVDSLGIAPNKLDIAYNSIYTEPFQAIPDSDAWSNTTRPLKLGIAARIEPEKGHIHLLEAMRILKSRGVPCTLRMTGDGSAKSDLERFVSEHCLSDRVEFIGWVGEVADFLDSIDLFVVPSIDSEGLPTTILEAMAAGRVVIATDVGGATEAISHRGSGWIIPPRDSEAIADAITTISADREVANAICRRARATVEESFTMRTMIEVIERMYARVCTVRKQSSSLSGALK